MFRLWFGNQASVPWQVAINFRATSGYVTDGPGQTYSLGEAYPVTRGGGTFGFSADYTANARDRNGDGSHTPKFAGMVFVNDLTGSPYFRVDLPAAGSYRIHCAMGDASTGQVADWEFRDGASTVLFSTSGAVAADHFKDATDTDYTNLTWPASEAGVTHTFATTQLRIYPAGASGNRVVAHLRVVSVGSGAPTFTGALAATAGAATFAGIATFAPGTKTGALAASAAPAVFAGSATFANPTYTGALAAAAAPAAFAGSAAFAAPGTFTGALAASAAHAVFAGSATFALPRVTVYGTADYNSWPAALVMPDGTVLVAHYSGPSHLGPNGQIRVAKSTDGGDSWASSVAYDGALDDRTNLGMSRLASGRILLPFYTYVQSPEAYAAYYVYSDDDGDTWSGPVLIANPLAVWCVPYGKIHTLADGTLIMPAYGLDGGSFLKSVLLQSADGGANWTLRGTIAHDGVIHYDETDVFRLTDSDLFAVVRAEDGNLYQVESSDGGATWGSPAALAFGGTSVSPDLTRMGDGSILLTYGKRTSPVGVFGRYSTDEGTSWGAPFAIYQAASYSDANNFGYPSVVRPAPDTVGVAYYAEDARGSGKTSVFWSTFNLADLEYAAALAATVGAAAFAGTATFATAARTGALAASAGPAAFAGSAAFTAPAYAGSLAVTAAPAAFAGSAAFAAEVYTAAMAASAAPAAFAGSASFEDGGATLNKLEATAPPAAFAGIATFTTVTRTGSLAASAAPAAFAGVASFAAVTRTGNLAASAGHATFAGSATFVKPTYTGALAASAGHAVFAGSASFTIPARTGALAATAPAALFAGQAIFASSLHAGVLAATAPAAAFAGTAVYTAPAGGPPPDVIDRVVFRVDVRDPVVFAVSEG